MAATAQSQQVPGAIPKALQKKENGTTTPRPPDLPTSKPGHECFSGTLVCSTPAWANHGGDSGKLGLSGETQGHPWEPREYQRGVIPSSASKWRAAAAGASHSHGIASGREGKETPAQMSPPGRNATARGDGRGEERGEREMALNAHPARGQIPLGRQRRQERLCYRGQGQQRKERDMSAPSAR